ncbi:MAG: type II toxin-antitoxin system RelE/ParE family toxin [Leptolyngbyaceae cyanobacterium bins.59]|nr:type II toxin-antitoxin system RelE/ParE family toxin [Leptolyngbyaceae cyanobacterium bins.59]
MQNEPPDNQSEKLQPSSDDRSVVTIAVLPNFQKNIRDLGKRYRNILADLQTVIQDLEAGNFVGDWIPGVAENYIVYKVRIKNSNIQKGKSAGYRLIYQVESQTSVLLLTMYSKSDREDITTGEIREILSEFYGSSEG